MSKSKRSKKKTSINYEKFASTFIVLANIKWNQGQYNEKHHIYKSIQ